MITVIHLENFKSFEDQQILLRPLTLLSGLNGMGKSSVLQSLLLLRQSYLQGLLPDRGLELNGSLVRLGTGRDILFEGAQSDEIAFKIDIEQNGSASWRFLYDRSNDVLELSDSTYPPDFYDISLFNDRFHYLQAERIGPRTSFDMSENQVREHHQLGISGEFTSHFLHVFGDQDVHDPDLAHPNAVSKALRDQVQAWMGEVSPGTRINVETYSDIDLVRLSYAFEHGRDVTSYYRATNVGFGITYTLPVLVAVLSSSPGSIVLLENPEAHLHPKGQVRMGELIARAANAGVQLVVETHSDHILNGIRIAARNGNVSPDDVALHFFQRPTEKSAGMAVEIVTPKLDSDGRIDFWPENFFDEWDKSLDELL